MTTDLRWGILGAGGIAATVADDIASTPGCILHAVAARDAGRAATFADAHHVAHSYGSYAALLADPDVDVVYIATTHAQHHELAMQALAAGKPLLVEKAFTLTAGQAREVVSVARAAGLFCMEAMWMRCNPLVRQLGSLVAEGRIGSLLGVRADLSRRFDFDPAHRLFDLAAGGGALLDLGVYPATFAWSLLGRPDRIDAVGSLSPTGSDVTVAQQWGYADGRVAQVYCSAAGDSPFAALVTGTDGWISVEPRIHRPQRVVVHAGANEQVIEAEPRVGNGYGDEIAEVARCLRVGLTESPLVPLDDTIGVLDVLDECRRQLGVRYPADEE